MTCLRQGRSDVVEMGEVLASVLAIENPPVAHPVCRQEMACSPTLTPAPLSCTAPKGTPALSLTGQCACSIPHHNACIWGVATPELYPSNYCKGQKDDSPVTGMHNSPSNFAPNFSDLMGEPKIMSLNLPGSSHCAGMHLLQGGA